MRTHRYRFGYVLVLILAALAFGLAAPPDDWAKLVEVALQALTLIAAVLASNARRWVLRATVLAAVVLSAGALTAVIDTGQTGSDSARVISLLLVALAPPAIVFGIVREFREQKRITIHTMFGVLCFYLLLGIFFATGLQAIQSVSHESMLTPSSQASSNFLYFSLVSLTTTGFGDVVAATRIGRSFAVTEALIGQIYLVTVVALIVGNLRPRRQARA